MNEEVSALLKRAMNGIGSNEETLRNLEAAILALKKEIQEEAECEEAKRKAARQPFEGAHPCLRNYPRSNIG